MKPNQDLCEKLNTLVHAAQKQNLLDKSAFEILVSETSGEVVYDILIAFKTTLAESIEQLLKIESVSYSDTHKIFHKLKGSSLLIGFKVLGNKCAHAMEITKDSPTESSNREIQSVVLCAQEVHYLVQKFIL